MILCFPSVLLLLMLKLATTVSPSATGFIYNGFLGAGLILDGAAVIEPSGVLRLTNDTKQEVGHAFHPTPFPFLNSSSGETLSFSTSFVFAIVPHYRDTSSEGLAFAISPLPVLPSVLPSQFFGLFNLSSDGDPHNHITAVEIDTEENDELHDINDNHVGIDVNSLISVAAAPAAFKSVGSSSQYLSLINGRQIRVWAEYDASSRQFNVTISPIGVPKPNLPLLSSIINLSSVLLGEMYVGFASSTGAAAASHYILGWSFNLNGGEKELNLSDLPSLAENENHQRLKKRRNLWSIPMSIGIVLVVLISLVGVLLLLRRREKFKGAEDSLTVYLPRKFTYKELHRATRGFNKENLLGNGGFGEVYKGVISKLKKEIAVKRLSNDSRQGMKEFLAEIATIGRLRHRNLVQLLGYSHRRGNLSLVYDFMPMGSLDRYLFGQSDETLRWSQRLKIIKGIAAGLLYLHEEWELVVLHRDIKASNVLLDAEFNGKLGDFGLARLHDRGSNAATTRVVGTLGYLAPELAMTGKSTTRSDVFAFGAFILEVACGRRPVETKSTGVEMVLVDWVLELLQRGELLEARDGRLGDEFDAEEVELVLRLGLMCSQLAMAARPSMRKVVQYLEREVPLPLMSVDDFYVLHSSSRSNDLVQQNHEM